jgi:hypothetical protein
MSVERELRANLLLLGRTVAEARGTSLAGIGRLISNNTSFFARIEDESKSFYVSSYDEWVEWFSTNWPPGVAWPKRIWRPAAVPARKIPDHTTAGA